MNIVQKQKAVNVNSDTQAELVYFPWNAGKPWTGGGTTVIDPIWHVVGEDGVAYYIDRQQKVYTVSELPISNKR